MVTGENERKSRKVEEVCKNSDLSLSKLLRVSKS